MTKNLPFIAVLCSIGLMAGCNKPENSSTVTSSGDRDSNTTATARVSRDETGAAGSPTSRSTNTPPRTYQAGVTNDATSTSFKEADNTGRNVRDRSDAALTPGDQGNSESDRNITQRIRRSLSTNDQFSTTAKNIKIITVDGKVTLRGPVKTPQEQEAVLTAVRNVAGEAAVDNQLEVKAQ